MPNKAFFLKRMNDHIVYLRNIKKTLDDSGDFCGTDYHTCKLGLWLYGDGRIEAEKVSLETSNKFEELFEPHKKFHQYSQNAVEAHEKGCKEEERESFTQMHCLSNTLISILLDLDSLSR